MTTLNITQLILTALAFTVIRMGGGIKDRNKFNSKGWWQDFGLFVIATLLIVGVVNA